MKFSLRSLLIAVLVGPPLLAGIAFWLSEAKLTEAILGVGLAILFSIAAFDFVRGY
jgi:hypothetical protein